MKALLDDKRATPGGRFRSATNDSRGQRRSNSTSEGEKPSPLFDAMTHGLDALHGVLCRMQHDATMTAPSSEALRIAAETLDRMVEAERRRTMTSGPASTGSEELELAQESIDEILRAAVDAFAHVPQRGGRS